VLKDNHVCVALSHYINDQLPKVDDLIPHTSAKNLIADIENTRRNTSKCSFFEKLESKSTKFLSKLTNMSPLVESTESSSEPKYDINTSKNISTRRSEELYELREKCLSTH
jgi:hypothetical protein